MVIPLTPEVLILREKKNKRKTMMNNITNTMCRLSDLTQEQIDSLVIAMPTTPYFNFADSEVSIGFHDSDVGTWRSEHGMKIVTYTEMMQLLGNNMNKQTAQEQMAVMQIEMDKLKAIIDKPEAKTGRVMRVCDVERNSVYYSVSHTLLTSVSSFGGHAVDTLRVDTGTAFHDEQSAWKYLEYLKLEQELRRAQIADGGAGKYKIVFDSSGVLMNSSTDFFHKISFNTHSARKAFRNTHTDEQLTLLIRGV
jgi:hypothetical protein